MKLATGRSNFCEIGKKRDRHYTFVPLFTYLLLASNSGTMDSIIHFELPADDTKRAGEFYMKAFGWMVNPMPEMDYTMIGTTPSDENGMPQKPGAINGGMPKRGEPVKQTVVTIGVDNIEDSLSKIEKLGGKRMGEKMAVGDMGWAAYFKDTEGNVVGLWQNARPMM
jgi:predicted enzyme related to lactoylglutathione lyase